MLCTGKGTTSKLSPPVRITTPHVFKWLQSLLQNLSSPVRRGRNSLAPSHHSGSRSNVTSSERPFLTCLPKYHHHPKELLPEPVTITAPSLYDMPPALSYRTKRQEFCLSGHCFQTRNAAPGTQHVFTNYALNGCMEAIFGKISKSPAAESREQYYI